MGLFEKQLAQYKLNKTYGDGAVSIASALRSRLPEMIITGNTVQLNSPSLNSPADILNLGDTSVSIQLIGDNILDLETLVTYGAGGTWSISENGQDLIIDNTSGPTPSMIVMSALLPFLKLGERVKFEYTTNSAEQGIILTVANHEFRSGDILTVTPEFLDSSLLFLPFGAGPIVYSNLILVRVYEAIELPKELDFGKLNFGKCDSSADQLIINPKQQKVIYKQNTNNMYLHSTDNWSLLSDTDNNINFYRLDFDDKYELGTPGYCNRFNIGGFETGQDGCLMHNTCLLYATSDNGSLDDWKAKLDQWEKQEGCPLQVIYGLRSTIEHDLSNTEFGQQLLRWVIPGVPNICARVTGNSGLQGQISVTYLTHNSSQDIGQTGLIIIDSPPEYIVNTNIANITTRNNNSGIEMLIKGGL